jgi:hypothetical protein
MNATPILARAASLDLWPLLKTLSPIMFMGIGAAIVWHGLNTLKKERAAVDENEKIPTWMIATYVAIGCLTLAAGMASYWTGFWKSE